MGNQYLEVVKSLVSALIFILLYRHLPFRVAVFIGFIYGAVFYIHRYIKFKKLGSFDIVAIVGMVVYLLLSLTTKNEKLLFIYPVFSNLVYASIFGVSLARKRDIVSFLARDLCDSEEAYNILRPAFRRLTLIWCTFYLLKAAMRAYGIFFWSFEKNYWTHWIVGTPGYFILIWFGFYYSKRYYIKVNNSEVLPEEVTEE